MVDVRELLSTCVHAAQLGCAEIRDVQQQRHLSSDSNAVLQVEFKDVRDPKSTLTVADGLAQRAVVQSLRLAWGRDLHIVGEEEDDDDDDDNLETETNEDAALKEEVTTLRRDLCSNLLEADLVNLRDVTVYVDPLDGTREFVEERLSNCQCLVGIAVNGKARAGAIGIPFPNDGNNSNDSNNIPVVVYGHVGRGHGMILKPTTHDDATATAAAAATLTPSNTEYQEQKLPRPWLATGDATAPVMEETRQRFAALLGGNTVLYGGAGNKILAAALGHVDATVQHKYGGPWDTCAPQAVLEAMGGCMTDVMGNELVIHQRGNNAPVFANRLGFVATGKASGVRHAELVDMLRQSPVVQEYYNRAFGAASVE